MNAGHGNNEIDVKSIRAAATAVDEVSDHVVRYTLESGPRVVVMAAGNPPNIVTNSGSPSPCFCTLPLGLTLEWLAGQTLSPGEVSVPHALEDKAAQLAMTALGLALADLSITDEVDELAVALVHALSRQDGERALALATTLEPLIGDRPALRARHATRSAQAHQICGDFENAATQIRLAIALAQAAESEATSRLKALKADIVRGKVASKSANALPLPDTLLGRAVSAMDAGDLEGGAALARQARIEAQSMGNARDEVFALLALARIDGQEDSAIRRLCRRRCLRR